MTAKNAGWRRARLLVPEGCGPGTKVKLSATQANYLTAVLRLGPGDEVHAFNGRGIERRCALVRDGRAWALADCARSEHHPTDALRQIHVGQGSAPRGRLDWAIEKMTESGAASFCALGSFGTARKDRIGGTVDRWLRIAAAASAQCGRFTMPSVSGPADLREWSAQLPDNCLRLLLSLGDAPRLSEVAKKTVSCGMTAMVVGRTAGLDQCEEQAAQEAGFIPVSLGKRVLRTETAGVVALTVLLAAAGEL